MTQDKPIDNLDSQLKAAIQVHKLSQTHLTAYNQKVALNNISFVLPAGKIGVLFGFSGSGKTAVLKTIAGLEPADSGTIEIFGKNINDLTEKDLLKFRREKISVVFESQNLISDLRIKENLLLPFNLENKKVAVTRLEEISSLFRINQILFKYPSQITLFEERKAALARAALTGKSLLLVFQPSSRISTSEQQQILSLLKLANREYGITVLFTTDLPYAASIADTAYFVHESQLIGEISTPSVETILFTITALEH